MQETIIVTTCSANHLAQAKGLGDSLLLHNPDFKLMIGLTDKLEGRVANDYYAPHDLVEAQELNIPEFQQMCDSYNVFELNCALKIFFAAYALEKYTVDKVIFLDSDMLVFESLRFIEEELDKKSILLTPHILTPFKKDGKRPFEREMLKNGIFNGGFFAVKNNVEGNAFITWWKERMIDQCYVNVKEGMFVDQKWLNLAPIFFPSLGWLQHPGCNAAYWNLHERTISKSDNRYFVNDEPLLFFHFSGYSIDAPNEISRHQDRVAMDDNIAVKELFHLYQRALEKNKHSEIRKLECSYAKNKSWLRKLGLKK